MNIITVNPERSNSNYVIIINVIIISGNHRVHTALVIRPIAELNINSNDPHCLKLLQSHTLSIL